MGNIKKNEENILIKISSKEAKILNKNYGVSYGENGISHTHGHHKKYFLTESRRNLGILEKMRKKNIISTVS